jgi:glyoxylate/hydroxypyruvate reductase A
MPKPTLALLIRGASENWSPQRWKARFDAACPDRRVVIWPDEACAPADVRYAAVWVPPRGELAGFANLRVIFNLGAGVDGLLSDPRLPRVPIVRVVAGDLTARMTEYVVLQVLRYHRQDPQYRTHQREKRWAPRAQWPAGAITVGIMGLGVLGSSAGAAIARLGFRVLGWSRTSKAVDGIECLHGEAQLDSFLQRTDVLVCLLPSTSDTHHILNRGLFAKLGRSSPLGAPVLINAGRGKLQNEADVLACLDDGTLGAACLDVFETEPLPADSPFWTHPKVVLTPHNAADSDPEEITRYIARQIERHEAGERLDNVVDPRRGY